MSLMNTIINAQAQKKNNTVISKEKGAATRFSDTFCLYTHYDFFSFLFWENPFKEMDK